MLSFVYCNFLVTIMLYIISDQLLYFTTIFNLTTGCELLNRSLNNFHGIKHAILKNKSTTFINSPSKCQGHELYPKDYIIASKVGF